MWRGLQRFSGGRAPFTQDSQQLIRELDFFRKSHPAKIHCWNGLELEYIARGIGDETVVLLPGLSRRGDLWFKLFDRLEHRFRMISVTLPAMDSMKAIATGVASLLKHEGVEQAHIMGNSLGGWVAQAVMFEQPLICKSLILSLTTGPSTVPTRRMQSMLSLTRLCPRWLVRFLLQRELEGLFTLPLSQRRFWRSYIAESLSDPSIKRGLISLLACSIDFSERYRNRINDQIVVKDVLIIYDSADTTFSKLALNDLISLYPKAKAVDLRESGHTAVYSNPNLYVPLLEGFLDNVEIES